MLARLAAFVALVALGQPVAGEQWLWEHIHPKTGGNSLMGVASGNGLLVAVGAQGTILTSEEGVVWTPRPSGTTATLREVLWSGELFLAVGDRVVVTSPDGVSWTSHGAPVSLVSVAFDGQSYRAVALDGGILASGDGLAWVNQAAPAVDFLDEVMWAGGMWVAVGGAILVDQGQGWFVAADASCRAVAHNGTVFVAVAFREVWVSSDGTQWSAHPGPAWSTSAPRVVMWNGDRFVAGGSEPAYYLQTFPGEVASSADGIEWSPFVQLPRAVSDLTWTGSTWLAVGHEGMIATSADGEEWRSATGGGSVHVQAIAADDDGEMVTVGGVLTPHAQWGELQHSADGLNYHSAQIPPGCGSWPWLDVAWTRAGWVTAGYACLGGSPDGRHWSTTVSNLVLSAISGSPAAIVAVGTREQGGDAWATVSPDGGLRWTEVPVVEHASFTDVTWDGREFVAVGSRRSPDDLLVALVAHSETGVEWAVEELPIGAGLDVVQSGGGVLLAGGRDGLLLVATDPGSWATVDWDATGTVSDLAWTGDEFLAAVENDGMWASSDGSTWRRIADIPFRIYGMTWSGGVLHAVGEGGIWRMRPKDRLPGAAQATVVPVIAHRPGLRGSFWRSDVQMVSTSAEWTEVWLSLPDVDPRLEERVLLPPGGQLLRRDALARTFGLENAAGPLMIHSTAPLAVATRIATEEPGGSYGQAIPASAKALGELAVVLAGLSATPNFRSNLGFANLAADHLSLEIVLWDAAGASRGSTALELPPHGRLQSGTLIRELAGGPIDGGWLEVMTPTPGGRFQAYASLVDNATNDPSTVIPGVASAEPWIVSAVANDPGLAGTSWRSDVEVVNPGPGPVEYHLELLVGERLASPTFRLSPHAARRHRDVVAVDFARTGAGILRVVPESGSLVVSSRTATDAQGGSLGQLVPAVAEVTARWHGKPLLLPGLAQSSDLAGGRRSNIGLANLSSTDLSVVVELRRGDGSLLATLSPTIPAESLRLMVGVLAPFAPIDNAHAVVRSPAPDPDALLLAFASVIDGASGDPVFISAR